MRLHTDPSQFSITAFLADQVSLLARHERLSPGAAVLRLRELSQDRQGRARLLSIVEEAGQGATDPAEAAQIAAIRAELEAWHGCGRFAAE